MRVSGIAASFPERALDNSQILDLVAERSRPVYDGDLDELLRQIDFYLRYSGARTRRWLREGQPFFPHIEDAIRRALAQSGITLKDVDLLIHASVDRRVMEPGQSFLIARALGAESLECFDVLEACNSWVRAVRLANLFLSTGSYQHVLIVTSEFSAHEGEWLFKNFAIRTASDLEWAFPALTVGEAATATVLSREPSASWSFSLSALPKFAELCLCPTIEGPPEASRYNGVDFWGKGSGIFMSYGKALQEAGRDELTRVFADASAEDRDVDIVIPHSHTRRLWEDIASKLGVDLPFFHLYPDYGNIVTSSVPAGIALAQEEERLKRGDKVGCWVAAAGMSFAYVSFRF